MGSQQPIEHVEPEIVADCARHLVMISKDLRSAGDVQQVRLDEDGVGPDPCTLADELWLIAVRLGWPISALNDGDEMVR